MKPARTSSEVLRGTMAFGDFLLELDTLRLRRGEEWISLQPKPAQVLAVLLSRAGALVSRDDIRREVWGPDTHLDFDQSLNVCIRQIRIALGDTAQDPKWLETVPRRGYRFLAAAEWRPAEEGIASPDHSPDQGRNRRSWGVALGGLLVFLVVVVFRGPFLAEYRAGGPAELPPEMPRLIVLPLESTGLEPLGHQLPNLLTDELIAQLGVAFSPKVGVLARSTSMRLQSAVPPLPELRQRFGVSYIIEGTVQRRGSRVRAAIQLIRAQDQVQVWAGLFERSWEERFHLPAEVGRGTVRALSLELPKTSQQPQPWERIAPPEAYGYFLTARRFLAQRTREGNLSAVEASEKALAVFPGLAPAHVVLGEAHLRELVHPAKRVPSARLATQRALELDPNLASAWVLLGRIQMLYDWDLVAAGESLRRALELNSSLASAHHAQALLISALGHQEEAVAEFELARNLDPLSPVITTDSAWLYFVFRKFEKAEAVARTSVSISPNYMGGHLMLQMSLSHQGKAEAAAEQAKRVLELAGASSERLENFSRLAAKVALEDYADRRYRALQQLGAQFFVAPGELAYAALAAGDQEAALDLFEAAAAERSDWRLLWLSQDPRFDPLRGSRRGMNLLEVVSATRK
ncbi:MAG: winged helix-turn-helix domain-containing protein [Deltaproteobacteria bacterium]|nr:winged helix-turn-helix domain-containing protein [Deltaproteobacteria bacterium]